MKLGEYQLEVLAKYELKFRQYGINISTVSVFLTSLGLYI
jgi:hypothetical protein